MPDTEPNKKQNSQYDKIIKENLEVTLPVIIRDVLGLDILLSEELPDDVQHTKERKPDALKKVTDTAGNIYVLQVEFQLEDEKEMIYRMGEYHFMLLRRYQLPIKQYVIFLKDSNPMMPTSLETEHLKFDFTLIRIADASYQLFLRSNNPEVKMLGILANFGKEDSYQVVKSIIDGIHSNEEGDFAKSRYYKQLRTFVQLRRNVEQQFDKIMQSISTFFKDENDYLYRKGETKGVTIGVTIGEEKKSHTVVEKLIKLEFTDEKAAYIADVDVAYVAKVRAELENK